MTAWRHAVVRKMLYSGNALIEVNADEDAKFPAVGESFLVRVRKPRNPKHHRLYWGMLKHVVDATGRWPNAEALHKWIKYALDMYETVAVDSKAGKVIIEWQGTDFMSMGQDEFKAFFEQAVGAIALETGIDPLALESEEL